MDVYDLPDFFNPGKEPELFVHDYRNDQDLFRGMVNLKLNAISFLQQGQKEVLNDQANTKIQDDSFLVMQSGNCLMTEKTTQDGIYSSFLLFYSDSRLDRFMKKHGIKWRHDSVKSSHWKCNYDAFLKDWVNGAKRVAQLNESAKLALLELKFEELMLYLFTQKNAADFLHPRLHEHSAEARIKNVVRNNLRNKLTLDELAFLSNLSSSSFKREFKKVYGQSPGRWFKEQRLGWAKETLEKGFMRPSEVYTEAGFDNLSAFSRSFKQLFGLTPGDVARKA